MAAVLRCGDIGESLDCLLQCSNGRAANAIRAFELRGTGATIQARAVTRRRRRGFHAGQLSVPALRPPMPKARG